MIAVHNRRILVAKKLLFTGIIILFLGQVLFNAIYCDEGIAPDESHHVKTAIAWSQSENLTIPETAWSIGHGPLNQFPYLYHLVLGIWYKAKPQVFSDFQWLRIPNILLAAMTICIGFVFLIKTKIPWYAQALSLFFLSNLLMFVFLSGMVSYDNGVNFLSAIVFIALLRAHERKDISSFILLLIFCLIGNLVKIIFLPISIGALAVAFVLCFYALTAIAEWRKFISSNRGRFLLLAVCSLTIANWRLYGVNYLHYGELYPSCQSVYGIAKCLKWNVFTMREVGLIEKITANTTFMSPLDFLVDYHAKIEETVFGIVGFDALIPLARVGELDRARVTMSLWVAAVLAGIFFSREFRRDRLMWSIFAASGFYGLILFRESWSEYRRLGVMVGIHGRYWFPILVPVLYIVHRAIFIWKNQAYTWIISVLLIYLYAGLGLNVQFAEKHRREFNRIFPSASRDLGISE